MIVKIMAAAGGSFPGVKYNDKKIEGGKGELMLMKNFPSYVSENSSMEDVKAHLALVSKSKKVKKPQFHAAISTKFREHTKEELTTVANQFMQEMGYGDQPFIVVFHNDTENNHVHIVSSRVDEESGKKIDDSFEKLKSQKAIGKVMKELYGISTENQIEKLLNYRCSTFKQLELVLEKSGFSVLQNKEDENVADIFKNGVKEKSFSKNQIVLSNVKNDPRSRQMKAIISKYKGLYSNKVFKVEDAREKESVLPIEYNRNDSPVKIEFESELQKKLREKFGIDVVFHHKDGQKPFGYTAIDHKTGAVYKGSELLKMDTVFEFTDDTVDKKLYERLKDFNISDKTSKDLLLKYFQDRYPDDAPRDFMLFENKTRKNKEVFKAIRDDVKEYLKNQSGNDVHIMKSETGVYYTVHSKHHYVGELESLLGEKEYQHLMNAQQTHSAENKSEDLREFSKNIGDLLYQLGKSSGGSGKDPMENEEKKRRKRKKR